MTISILNPSLLTALNQIGSNVPEGTQRIFRAVGVHNSTEANIMLTLYLVPVGEVADLSNRIIHRLVLAGKTDMCPELIGRGLNIDGSLWGSGVGLTVGYTTTDNILG